jgi:hypothetical protein
LTQTPQAILVVDLKKDDIVYIKNRVRIELVESEIQVVDPNDPDRTVTKTVTTAYITD